MTEDHRRENAAASVLRADQEMVIAQNCQRDGFFHAAVSHAYYSAFHYAVALLFTEGLQAKTHGGLAHMVNVAFVRSGLLSPRVFRALSHLERDREIADYDAMVLQDLEAAQEAIALATEFNDACRAILEARGF